MNRKIKPSVQGTSCLHGSWESKNIFYWELFLYLQNCEENQPKWNHSLFACENLEPIQFSPKLKLLDGSNALLNPIMCLPLALVLRGKELSSRRGGSTMAAIPPGHRLGPSCTASRLCQTHHFLWCNPTSCTTEEGTSGCLWRLSHVPLQ